MSWTTFLTMALATERYLAVCCPIFYRSLGQTLVIFPSVSSPAYHCRSLIQLQIASPLVFAALDVCLNSFKHSQVLGGQTRHVQLHAEQRDPPRAHVQRDQSEAKQGLHVLLHTLDEVNGNTEIQKLSTR